MMPFPHSRAIKSPLMRKLLKLLGEIRHEVWQSPNSAYYAPSAAAIWRKARSKVLSGSCAGACYRIKNILILCSRRIFGLRSQHASERRFGVPESCRDASSGIRIMPSAVPPTSKSSAASLISSTDAA